jgi:hypothetical protein
MTLIQYNSRLNYFVEMQFLSTLNNVLFICGINVKSKQNIPLYKEGNIRGHPDLGLIGELNYPCN